MNIEEFKLEVDKLGIKLDEDKLKSLTRYATFLLEYNEHTNLTAIKDIDSIYLKHFYDSLTIAKVIDLNKYKTLIDVGTGAGFPGVVLKIFYPNLEVTLLDSNNKKITFLNELIKKLNLKNISTVNSRSEEYAKKNLDYYDIVVARGVKNLPVLTELCLPLVKEKGYFIAMKANADDEIESSKKIISTLNGRIENQEEFNMPIEESLRTLILIEKMGPTPKGYPRSYNKIISSK